MGWVNTSLTGAKLPNLPRQRWRHPHRIIFGGGTKQGRQWDIDKAKELLTEYKAHNPSKANLAAIFRAVREKLQVSLQAHSVAA